MKPAFKIVTVCCLLAMVTALVVQRRAIMRTRGVNESLRQQTVAAATTTTEPIQTSPEEISQLEHANRDLPKLRNEVRTLREEKRELQKVQRENERLAAALKAAPKATAPRMSEAEGFVLKEKWSRAGFATPEATMQTFFWAIANKDVGALAECATGDFGKSMEQEMQRSVAQGKQFEEHFEPFAKMQGFRIADQKQLSDDKVELSIQAAASGRELLMRLQRIGGEWKLADF